ncbi:aminoglycoside phosphotransferase family protein [Deinococcus aluminii]|uniref:Aminoglycoside phosphotransferase domain-containing protein n=1 Tax=Deinococcus aluminii TaxID=1656885 RepID=A0ABP9XCE8_9DEIO
MGRHHGDTADRASPHLRRLTVPAEAERCLNAALSEQGHPWLTDGAGPLRVQAVTVLREHAGSRWTLRYAVRRGEAERTLIGKVYARDRRDVLTLLTSLRAGALGPGQPMQVPAPVAYLPGLRLLLVEEAPGIPARTALRRGDTGALEQTARWLATFHAAAVPLPTSARPRDPLHQARRWAKALGEHAPHLKGEARHLLAALTERAPRPGPLHLVHGDFSVSHVYVSEGTTTVIDWDSWEVGDIGEDAGRLYASLQHLAARHPARYGTAAGTFAAFYRQAVPAARGRLPFYAALSCLRTAKRLTAKGVPHRIGYAETLLAAGQRVLARAGG